MMHDRRFALAAVALAALAATGGGRAQEASKKLYCWEEGGRKVCGDALPPDKVDRARTEINARSGMATNRVARALTEAERAEAARQATLAAAAARAQADDKRRDLAMVDAYATEADLRRAYRDRMVLVEEALKASKLGIANLGTSLVVLLRQAAEAELQGKPVPRLLQDRILAQHRELRDQTALQARQQQEQALLNKDLESALGRYRALKGGAPAPATAPAAPATPAG